MLIRLDQLYLKLSTDSELVRDEWVKIFGLFDRIDLESIVSPDLELRLNRQHLPSAFRSDRPAEIIWENEYLVESVDELTFWITLPDQAFIMLNLPGGASLPTAEVYLSPDVKDEMISAVLEDVTTVALTPLLRRFGYMVLHGFAVGLMLTNRDDSNRDKPPTGVIICGPSGSGKSTLGMQLVLEEEGLYYSNDNILIKKENETIHIVPSWGTINLTENSIERLRPQALISRSNGMAKIPQARSLINGKVSFDPQWFKRYVVESMPVRVILFPMIKDNQTKDSTINSMTKSEAMARLMEESIDLWDQAWVLSQLDMITLLLEDALSYSLGLGLGREGTHLREYLMREGVR